jgi:hypothetical protein
LKKNASFLLLLLLLLYFGGPLAWLQTERWMAHERWEALIQNKLSPQSTDRLVLSESVFQQLVWEEDGREFWYQGQLYDVLRVVHHAQYVEVFALNDTAETAAFQVFAQQVWANQSSNIPLKQTWLRWFFEQPYCETSPPALVWGNSFRASEYLVSVYPFIFYPNPDLTQDSPPPDLC